MKTPLKKFTIAVTGEFGEPRTHDKMKQWIEANGGTFATKISAKVTHLVCSREHYKKSVAIVQQARKIKGLKIVTFDWLEDSLMAASPKRAGSYLLSRHIKTATKVKAERKAVRKQNIQKGYLFEKSCLEFQTDMHSDGYHPYRDPTSFLYTITLARIDLLTNKNERYALALHETHALPHLYCTYVKFHSPGLPASVHVLAPLGSDFETAMGAFERFFEVKTRRAWGARKAWGERGEGEGIFVYWAPKEEVTDQVTTILYGGKVLPPIRSSDGGYGLPTPPPTHCPKDKADNPDMNVLKQSKQASPHLPSPPADLPSRV